MMCLVMGISQGAELNQLIELTDAASSWTVHAGTPLYYTSTHHHYQVVSQEIRALTSYDAKATINLSPSSDYRLLSMLQDLDQIKNSQRSSDYFVLNSLDELVYKVSRGTSADLKPLVAAISDQGILALADPVRAHIYLYQAGNLISEGQLYESEGDRSLERNIYLQWVDDQCYIILERPGRAGSVAQAALMIRINAAGRNQQTSILPFSYLQKFIFQANRLFISGYDYDPQDQKMNPLIVEVSARGKVLWSNENFGHELAISSNGRYLAALSSHEDIQLFDLQTKRVRQIHYDHADRVSLGLSINDQGQMAVIRVPVDFFVKRNSHAAQIYFPETKRTQRIQLDPRFPKIFQLHSDGDHFFIGTNYEWLEIR